MKQFILPVIYLFLFSIILLTGSCSSQKENVVSVSMQNITARYNILYNAKTLLETSQKNIEAAYLDDYEQYLSVYKEPTEISSKAELKILDSVIQKTNSIVAEKIKSNYVDDAYFLKGESNYFKGNYFNASEFFDYVYITYPEEKELRQASLVWKARAQLQLNNLSEAAIALDTAIKHINTEKISVADIYATRAGLYIKSGKETEAIKMLEGALKFEKNKSLNIRWTYLLAQLQQHNNQLQAAYDNYARVIKSNAPFEMAFNANLNRIHIEEEQSGRAGNQIDRFKALLKDNKNKDFIDQIHYHIAQLYLERGEQESAIKSYNTAIQSSTKNQNQKGVAYLQLAEIYFKNGDYKHAKTYYDSTLTVLSPAYSNYELIRLKSSNLELLADRFQTIAREDTLQMLARLPQADRDLRIDALLLAQSQKATGTSASISGANTTGANNPLIGASAADSKFYFNNVAALSQGFTDFKLRWGSRKLEDNWRRSSKTATETTNASNVPNVPASGGPATLNSADTSSLRKSYVDNLPLTPPQLEQSNQKIINAYYDVANFYKDVLKDNDEAVKTYQELLKHYPDNSLKPVIYYNLYRLYSTTGPAKSAEYRDILVKQYPETAFTKAILDPNYSQKADEKALALNQAYNTIYNLYTEKKYNDVITKVQETEQQFGPNSLSSQLAYLNSLATGRTQKADIFESSLQQIVQTYPDDKLITPLIKQNLEYVQANRDAISKRIFALVDTDPNESQLIVEPKEEPASQSPVIVSSSLTNLGVNPPAQKTSPALPTPAPLAIAKSSIFSLPDSSEYYFVINVSSPGVNLSSSRFSIGQFNRASYGGITHQLQDVNNENQLIFIGPFYTRFAVARYQRDITPQIKDIMKIPANSYNTFIITKTDVDKLDTQNTINAYLEFHFSNNK